MSRKALNFFRISYLILSSVTSTFFNPFFFSYTLAVASQPKLHIVSPTISTILGLLCTAVGTTFVITSTYRLGIVGTYLGDYFGILMKERVTAFPYNVTSSPMYDGSVLNFLGLAIKEQSPAGLLLTLLVWIVYRVACRFEEYFPFSSTISFYFLFLPFLFNTSFCVCACFLFLFIFF